MARDRSDSVEASVGSGSGTARLRSRLQRRSFPWIVVGALVVAAVPLGWLAKVVTAASYRDSPPPCFGLGWGCSFSPGDVGVLMGIFWLIAVASLAALLLISEFFWRRVAVARSVATVVTAGIALVAWVVFGLQVFP